MITKIGCRSYCNEYDRQNVLPVIHEWTCPAFTDGWFLASLFVVPVLKRRRVRPTMPSSLISRATRLRHARSPSARRAAWIRVRTPLELPGQSPRLRAVLTSSTIRSLYSGGYRPRLLPAMSHFLGCTQRKHVHLSGATPVRFAVRYPTCFRKRTPPVASTARTQTPAAIANHTESTP